MSNSLWDRQERFIKMHKLESLWDKQHTLAQTLRKTGHTFNPKLLFPPKVLQQVSVMSTSHRSHELSVENPKSILVIEDQALNRKVVRIVLQSEGYEVIEAVNAAEALAYLETSVPALILMDIALPGKSGEELTRQIKSDPNWCRIPIIALTAAAMSGDRERLLKAGCDDYLSKPIDIQVLVERVAHHLKGSTP